MVSYSVGNPIRAELFRFTHLAKMSPRSVVGIRSNRVGGGVISRSRSGWRRVYQSCTHLDNSSIPSLAVSVKRVRERECER